MIHTARAGEREKYQGVSGIHDCFDQLKRALRSLTPLVAVAGALAIGSRAVAQGAASGGAPIVDSISPDSVIEKPVPQPEIVIAGANLRQPGVFGPPGLPTITITHTELPKVSFSVVANADIAGTQATIAPGLNDFNMLQMPGGVYDLTLSRPDGQSITIDSGFAITSEPEPEPGNIELRVAGFWGGPILGMDVSEDGNVAYIANGRMLRTLDISDPTNPTELGSIYLTAVNDVKVREGYAFVGAHNPHAFCVVDVTDPENLELVWKAYDGGDTNAQVTLYGDFAYVGDLGSGGSIHIYEISDPLNVEYVDSISVDANSFTITDDRLYVGRDSSCCHLTIYDLGSNPTQPLLLGTVPNAGIPHARTVAVAAKGDYAYVIIDYGSIGDDVLLTVNVVNPNAPVAGLSIQHDRPLNYSRLALEGDLLYLVERWTIATATAGFEGALVFDIGTDPSSPTLVASHQTRGGVADVLPIGDTLYFWDLGEGFVIIDASDLQNFQRIGNYHSPTDLREMAKSGDYLYVADGWGGFTILNVADGAAPVVESVYLPNIEQDGYADVYGIVERDGLVYLTLRRRFEIVDVTNPTSPVLIDAYSLDDLPEPFDDNWLRGVTVSGNTAYLGYGSKLGGSLHTRLLELNIADPENITYHRSTQVHYVGTTYPRDTVYAIAPVVGAPLSLPHYRYLIGTPKRLVVAADMDTSEQIGETDLWATDQSIAGGLAFTVMADTANVPEFRGLRIEDVSDPANPILLSQISGTSAYAVEAAASDRLYVVGLDTKSLTLNLLDVSNPSMPQYVDSLVVGSGAERSNILVDEPQVFVTTTPTGGNGAAKWGLVSFDVHGLEPAVAGDLNGNGVVDVVDLLILLGAWGDCADSRDCPADLNDDATVNVFDLLILIGNWG